MTDTSDGRDTGPGFRMRIRAKILGAFLGLSVVSLAVFGYVALRNMRAMSDYALEHIASLGKIAVADSTRNMAALGEAMIKDKAKGIAGQVEVYLRTQPGMTVPALQASSEFKHIAVQKVGETGYTSIMDVDTGYFYFHPQERLVNTDTHVFANTLPSVWRILDQTIGKYRDSSGYYEWKEADGSMRQKYMALATIRGTTADNKRLFIAATTYIDEFSRPVVETKTKIAAATLATKSDIGRQLDEIRSRFIGVLIVLIVVASGTSILLSRTITNPILALTEAARRLERGGRFDSTRLAGVTGAGIGSDELGDLVRVFGRMAVALEQRAEDARLAAEARYRNLFESVPVGLYRTTPGGQFLVINPALVTMLGYPDPESLMATNASDTYVDAEDRSRWRALLERQEVIRGFEVQVRRRDGAAIWVRSNARVVRDREGQLLYYEGTLEDITELKQAEETLRENEERQRALFREAEESRQVLHQLYRVALSMQAARQREDQAQAFLQGAHEVVGLDRIYVMLASPDGSSLEPLRGHDFDTPPVSLPLSPAAGPYYQALETRRPVAVLSDEDFQHLLRMDPAYANHPYFRSRRFVVTPLVVGDRTIGVAAADNKISRRPIPPASIEPFSLLCQQFALTLEEARLFEDVRKTRDFLQSIAENSADGIVTTDVDGRITYFSPGAEEIFGYRAAEVLGSPVADYYQSGPEEARALMRRLRAEGRVRNHEYAFRAKDGRWIEVESSMSLLRDTSGSIAGTLGILKDITVRKRAAEALRESEQRFRDLADLLPQTVFECDEKGNLTFGNRSGLKSFGYTQEDFVSGMNILQLITPEDRERAMKNVVNLLRREKVSDNEFTALRKDGSTFPFLIFATPVISSAHDRAVGFRGFVIDITERKLVEQMKSDFVSLVTHQLRTPLSGIKWLLELAAQGPEVLEETRTYIHDARESAERLIRLVNELLDISRLEMGRLTIVPQDTHLGELTRSVVDELSPLIREKGHRLGVIGAEDLPPILVDPQLLRQVILNLTSNAVKYTLPDGKIAIRMGREGASVRWAIQDSGIGIPREAQPRLFEKFYRADNALTVETEGTGLGLYLVRLIVERFGGRVWCESEEGKGATFLFTLPVPG